MIVLILPSEQILKLWSWKTQKGHGKSWNFKIFKKYEPCNIALFLAKASYHIFSTNTMVWVKDLNLKQFSHKHCHLSV